MKEMFRILFLMVTYYCILAKAKKSCQNATISISRNLYFSDLILRGHGYRNVTGISLISCGNLCLSDTRCVSLNFWKREKLCELNGASASQFPQALAESSGSYYYGPEEDIATKQTQEHLCQDTVESDYTIFLTPEMFSTADLTKAGQRCAQCDMQLCSLAQLKAAYDAGYRNGNWGSYDTVGRDTKVMSCAGYSWYSTPGECYFTGDIEMNSSIPNTPRASANLRVYCCNA